jgi:diguanylate cyclase (GGDEF)-like protein
MSLRIKFVLALLLTGLASVALVGVLTFSRVTHKVDEMRRRQAANHFQETVTAYFERYGDWRKGNQLEPFRRFSQRRRAEQEGFGPQAQAGDAPAVSGAPAVPAAPEGRPGPWEEEGPGNRPPPGMGGDGPPGPPPDDAPGNRDRGPDDGPPPERGGPLYHFILADAQYRVLLGGGVYRDGEPLPAEARRAALPVNVKGNTVAYISLEGVLTPSRQEQEYLSAVHDALMLAAGCAALLALGLGLLLGTGLSRRLLGLTNAVQAMRSGTLRQQVPVKGRDEVAALAAAFNDMSADLAKSHEELHSHHQTILQQADQLKELSVRDALTELYNRRHFDEQATSLYNQSMRHGRPLALVIADIDFFKRINDQFSHATGDAVLRQVSAILRSHVRLSDLVARYGGEEFVIALPETALPQAAALCDKLRDMIERFPWHQVHPELKVTMSMGVYADLAAGTAEAMLRKADELLYRAKESGRNKVCFA